MAGSRINTFVSALKVQTFDPDLEKMLGHKVRNISLSCNGSMESLAISNLSNLDAWFCVSQGLELGQKKNWVALLIMLIVVITITGNILVIMAVTMERKLQNATNYFFMSLAVADMLLGFLIMPISMVTILYGELIVFDFFIIVLFC
ncbi:5-hydroxytryptamine receptor 2A [Tachysurus ichikawai]